MTTVGVRARAGSLRQVRRWRQAEKGTRRWGQETIRRQLKGPEVVIVYQRWGTEQKLVTRGSGSDHAETSVCACGRWVRAGTGRWKSWTQIPFIVWRGKVYWCMHGWVHVTYRDQRDHRFVRISVKRWRWTWAVGFTVVGLFVLPPESR